MNRLLRLILVLVAATGPVGAAEDSSPTWRYGLAQAKITPEKLFWMGGFAARRHPAEGTLDDLFVKALALEAPDGGTCVLITADLVGIPKWLYDQLSGEIQRRHHLDRSRIRFASSHTHSGPVLTDALSDIYPLDDQQRQLIDEYSRWLEGAILDTVTKALATRSPATLWAGEGRATIAFNRRTNDEGKRAEMLSRGDAPKGPSDFAVPVLAVRSPHGQLRAVVFGYAAHTSALTDNYRWSADYAGVTRRTLEQKHPGMVALFFQGCGSDQSAVPRGTVERCQALGETLASSVETALAQPLRQLAPTFRAAFEFVSLDFATQPTRAELETVGQGTDYRARWARRLSADLAAGKTFARGYPEYPVQVWWLGKDQLWIALGGEVCVDYALRFKREFGAGTWVNGYANDVMAYIPSRRLWEEGGYQAGAFEVYGLPATRWCPDIEDRIAGTVGRLVKQVQAAETSPAKR
jgi:neutral ceramidase